MTSPTDIPDLGGSEADFDDLAVETVQNWAFKELGIRVPLLGTELLLELLRPHILQSLTATLDTTEPTPYVVRMDALTLAVQRAAGCPGCLEPEKDISLEMAPLYERLLLEAIADGTAPVELVDGNTENCVDRAPTTPPTDDVELVADLFQIPRSFTIGRVDQWARDRAEPAAD